MQVDIAGAKVDLDQLELVEGDHVADALLVTRIQRADDGLESLAIACSDGTSYFVQRGLVEGLRDRLRYNATDSDD